MYYGNQITAYLNLLTIASFISEQTAYDDSSLSTENYSIPVPEPFATNPKRISSEKPTKENDSKLAKKVGKRRSPANFKRSNRDTVRILTVSAEALGFDENDIIINRIFIS